MVYGEIHTVIVHKPVPTTGMVPLAYLVFKRFWWQLPPLKRWGNIILKPRFGVVLGKRQVLAVPGSIHAELSWVLRAGVHKKRAVLPIVLWMPPLLSFSVAEPAFLKALCHIQGHINLWHPAIMCEVFFFFNNSSLAWLNNSKRPTFIERLPRYQALC